MATKTDNYNLNVAELTDVADIVTSVSSNFPIIDAQMKTNADNITAEATARETADNTKVNIADVKNTGSVTNGVYFDSDGKAQPMTYSLAKSVTADAKLTDTVTTVTVSGTGNAITALSASNGAITATKGSTFLTSVGTVIAAKGSDTQPVYISSANTASVCTMANQTTTTGLAKIIATDANTSVTTTATSYPYVQVNGLQVEWGYHTSNSSSRTGTVTFTRAFTNLPAISIAPYQFNELDTCVSVTSVSKTAFSYAYEDAVLGSKISWIAVGYHS